MRPLSWSDLPGWEDDDHAAALAAFSVTADLAGGPLPKPGTDPRAFFETHFEPLELTPQGAHFTGYYEPELPGSRQPSARFSHALYTIPAGIEPETPWFSRAEITAGNLLAGQELVYLETAIEAFLAQVQGSLRVRLEDGSSLRLGFAGKNGHPYRSIGKELVARGIAPAAEMTPERIRLWCAENPGAVPELLNTNPSFVFFRLLDLPETAGPPGAMGRPVSPGRSLAIDPDFVPLGSPVWIESPRIGARLVVAQDIGSAIRGLGRGDLFFGSGPDAGRHAGALNEAGRMVVLRRRP
jgi:membrane-bound lytic murein transglycosylase A